MNMKNVDDNNLTDPAQDPDGQAMLKMMNAMQNSAPQQPVNEPQQPVENQYLNTKQNIYKVPKADDTANYWEIKDLPTKGRLYPAGTMIEARPLKVMEVKKLASINESNADYVVNDILRRTVRGIAVDELYVADKMYIIFWLRANTYRDSKYTVKFDCPKCKQPSKYHFEIENINVNELPEEYDPNEKFTLDCGDVITMSFLKVKDDLEGESFIETNIKTLGEIDSEIVSLASMVNTINGSPASLAEKYNYITELLSPKDFSDIYSFANKYSIGIDNTLMAKCEECGGVSPMGITFRPEFFLPERTVG